MAVYRKRLKFLPPVHDHWRLAGCRRNGAPATRSTSRTKDSHFVTDHRPRSFLSSRPASAAVISCRESHRSKAALYVFHGATDEMPAEPLKGTDTQSVIITLHTADRAAFLLFDNATQPRCRMVSAEACHQIRTLFSAAMRPSLSPDIPGVFSREPMLCVSCCDVGDLRFLRMLRIPSRM